MGQCCAEMTVSSRGRHQRLQCFAHAIDDKVNMSTANRVAIAAVEKAAMDLGLAAIEDAVADRIAEYGVSALVECTLAAQDFCAIDVALRAALHARTQAYLGGSVLARVDDGFTSLSDDPQRSMATTHKRQAAPSLAAN
jgi:hypothetical protein